MEPEDEKERAESVQVEPLPLPESPFNIPGIDTAATTKDILLAIKDSSRRTR